MKRRFGVVALFVLLLVLVSQAGAVTNYQLTGYAFYVSEYICDSPAQYMQPKIQHTFTADETQQCPSRNGETAWVSPAGSYGCTTATYQGPGVVTREFQVWEEYQMCLSILTDAKGCRQLTANTCSSCPAPNQVVGGVCRAPCATGETWDSASLRCLAPPCPAGAQFLGHGASTSPQCLSGCAYALGSESRYTPEGVLSRWVGTGTTCTGSSLTPADSSGCPNEVAEDLRPLLCGLAPPCETGKFLFNGECVADTSEAGCVIIDGEQICAEADQNCVVVDGKRVCVEAPQPQDLETYKENGCVWSLAQGAWVCPSDTGKKTETSTTTSVTDPVTGQVTKTTVTTTKDNVLPGVQISTTTKVFDSNGNELSSETVTKTQGGGGQGSALVARPASDLGVKDDLDWLRTYEEVRDSLSDQWDQLEVVQAVRSFQNLSLTAVQGVCPEFCLPLWGSTLCTTAHCDIWAQVSFVIQGVLLALYGMAAIRIVLSA